MFRLLMILVVAFACANKAKNAASSPTKPAVAGGTAGNGASTAGGDTKKNDACLTVGGYGLLATVNYQTDIKPILDRSCIASCHPGQSFALNTFADAKAKASSMSDSVNGNRMPKNNPLSAAEKKLFKDWVAAGSPETDTSGNNNNNNNNSNNNGNNSGGSGSSGSDKDRPSDDFFGKCTDSVGGRQDFDKDQIIDKKKVAECKKQDKIYDYDRKRCIAALAEYECDREGIIAAFKEKKVLVETKLDEKLDDGYKIDQCGEESAGPVVIFIRDEEEIDSSEDGVSQTKLCMPGSSLCK